MKLMRIAVLAFCLNLTACVTTQVDGLPEANDKEAAALNLQLGVEYLRQGKIQQARLKLERSIEENSQVALAHSALAVAYQQLGDMDAAEKSYRRALRLGPDDPDSLNSLAVFLCSERNDTKTALKYFDEALSVPLYPKRAMLYTNAGVCAKEVDLVQAESYLRKAVSMAPEYPEPLLQLIDVAYQQENYLQARAFLERYLSINPVSPDVLWLGFQLETQMGDRAAARGYGDHLKKDFPQSVEARMLLEEERNAG
ncbi:MAG: type IV pilus biogenesis/stability protein PilW [Gammaproteobacteria bacterium]